MSYTPGPEQPDELQEFETATEAIDQMQRPWWWRMWNLPCLVLRRVREWRGK